MSKADDAAFLSTEFDLASTRAASLVTETKAKHWNSRPLRCDARNSTMSMATRRSLPRPKLSPSPAMGASEVLIGNGKARAD